MSWWKKPDRPSAEDALRQSTQQLAKIRQQEPEVNHLVSVLRTAGETNHFIERLNMHVTRGNQ